MLTKTFNRNLSHLINNNIDDGRILNSISQKVSNYKLHSFLQEQAEVRNAFVTDLSEDFKFLKYDAVVDEGFAGKLNDVWSQNLTVNSDVSDEDILKQVLKSKKSAYQDYFNILEGSATLPIGIISTLSNHLFELNEAINNVTVIEDII